VAYIKNTTKTLIVGQGYVGVSLAVAAVSAGHVVTGVDTDRARLDLLRSGISPVSNVPSAVLQQSLKTGRYAVSDDYGFDSSFDFAVIAVPTPLKDGRPQLRFIEEAAVELAKRLSPNCTVILESTTYPGTTEELLVPLLEEGSGLVAGLDFLVGYSPERIDPGNETWNLLNTPKITSGINPKSAEAVSAFYVGLGISCVPVSGTREAEMTKLLENTFRHVNIALVNELLLFANYLGVDFREALDAAKTKPFGFMGFDPGPGVGGHCLPVDPSYLSWAISEKSGKKFQFVELANQINLSMPSFVADRAIAMLENDGIQIRSSKIAVFGLAYKANTADIRESPALEVVRILESRGATVSVFDTLVPDLTWPTEISRDNGLDSFEVGIILVAHSNLKTSGFLERCNAVLDTRGVLAGPNVTQL